MFEYQARAIADGRRSKPSSAHAPRPARRDDRPVPRLPRQHRRRRAWPRTARPVGYPLDENDHGLTVVRVDDISTRPAHALATYVNYAQHGESLDGYDLISADWLAPFQRFVDRGTGAPVVFSQGAVGSAEGPYEHAYPKGKAPTVSDRGDAVPAVWAHVGYAQAERGAHLLADQVLAAWRAARRRGSRCKRRCATDVPCRMLTRLVAGPAVAPLPERLELPHRPHGRRLTRARPSLGLPDCERASGAFGQALPAAASTTSLRAAGLPVPATYDAPSLRGGRGERPAQAAGGPARRRAARLLRLRAAERPDQGAGDPYGRRLRATGGTASTSPTPPRSPPPGRGDPPVAPCFPRRRAVSYPDPRDRHRRHARLQRDARRPSTRWRRRSTTRPTAGTTRLPPPPPTASRPTRAQIKGNFTGRELDPTCGYAVSRRPRPHRRLQRLHGELPRVHGARLLPQGAHRPTARTPPTTWSRA